MKTDKPANLSKLLATALLVVSLASCGDEAEFSGSTGVGKSTPEIPPEPVKPEKVEPQFIELTDRYTTGVDVKQAPVDIIFLVDTSGSMNDEKSRLETNLDSFITNLTQKNQNLDYQIFLIGSGFNFPSSVSTNNRIEVVSQYVGSNDALFVGANFLSGNYHHSLQLRENSVKQFIVITDDNARPGYNRMNADGFNQTLTQLGMSKIHFNGLIGVSNSAQNSWCTIEQVGSEYQTLAANPDYPGLVQDLCNEDWSTLLANLSSSILESIPNLTYALTDNPLTDMEIEVYIDDELLGSDDYSYNPDSNSIVLSKDLEIKEGNKLEIIYYTKNPNAPESNCSDNGNCDKDKDKDKDKEKNKSGNANGNSKDKHKDKDDKND